MESGRHVAFACIEGFLQARTLTGTVKWSTTPLLQITDEDFLKAAKVVARDRRRRERDLEQKALEEKWRKRREEREAWLKKCEEEAVIVRERLFLESSMARARCRPTCCEIGNGAGPSPILPLSRWAPTIAIRKSLAPLTADVPAAT